MQTLNKLGLKVAGLTSLILLVGFGLYSGGKAWRTQSGADRVAKNTDSTAPADRDQDGLPDEFEKFYHTNERDTDTDGDGVSDLQEITRGRDPSIAGTQDESRPPTGKNVTALDTHTQRYLATLPEDIAREEILNKDRLEAFVALNRGTLLPAVAEPTVQPTPPSKENIEAYLNHISSAHNTELSAVTNSDVEKAFTAHLQLQAQEFASLITKLERNVLVVKSVAVPSEVVELHKKLVAASQALLTNAQQLQAVDDDFVGGLIAAQNIQDLGPVFSEVAQGVQQLEQKYGIQ